MFCNMCVQLIKEEAKKQFQEKHPDSEILSSSINTPTSSCLILLEISLNSRHGMEYEEVRGVRNFCLNCGSNLGG